MPDLLVLGDNVPKTNRCAFVSIKINGPLIEIFLQACLDRVCENMTVENDQAETSGDEDENDSNKANKSPKAGQRPVNGKKQLQLNLKDCAIPLTRMNSGNTKAQVRLF